MLLTFSVRHMQSGPNNGSSSAVPDKLPAKGHVDPEVKTRAPRRRFTAAEKLRILSEADRCTKPGQIGELLRHEGIYSVTLANFRKQRDEGKLSKDPKEIRLARLEKDAARQRDARKIAYLEAEVKKLNVLLDLQKKVAELYSLPPESPIDF